MAVMARTTQPTTRSALAKKTTKAIVDYEMIEDGDRIMVGLSGGKDSWALLQMLDVLRQRRRSGSRSSPSTSTPATRTTSTTSSRRPARRAAGSTASSTPASASSSTTSSTPIRRRARCARGCGAACCTAIATEVGATKIALGHHADDFIETLLLNLFFAGALKAMPAKLVSDDGAHVVIRPLVYVGEDEARAYAKESELPIIGCCCPACGDLGLQRQRVKRLLMELEREHPGVKQSMLKALGNVAPRHLLDTRLNPPAELRDSAAATADRPKGTADRPKGRSLPVSLTPVPVGDGL